MACARFFAPQQAEVFPVRCQRERVHQENAESAAKWTAGGHISSVIPGAARSLGRDVLGTGSFMCDTNPAEILLANCNVCSKLAAFFQHVQRLPLDVPSLARSIESACRSLDERSNDSANAWSTTD